MRFQPIMMTTVAALMGALLLPWGWAQVPMPAALWEAAMIGRAVFFAAGNSLHHARVLLLYRKDLCPQAGAPLGYALPA